MPAINMPEMPSRQLLDFYEDHLRRQVLPFWLRYCVDREYGGILNCVADDGTLRSTDKYVWSQGRALWTFSALYNVIEKNPAWLQVADGLAGFLRQHGRGPDKQWAFCLHRDGSPALPPQSVYVDAFIIHGFAEYAKATGQDWALQIAREAFERTSPLLDDHSALPTEPNPIPAGLQAHGPFMIFANAYHELGLVADDRRILDRSRELAERVMREHVKPDLQLVLEWVQPGGVPVATDAGQTFLPGHAIESMWFLERIFRHHGRSEWFGLNFEAMRWNLEKGWDREYGGLFLACHATGGPPHWPQPQSKVWWPHTEALYALLRAYEATGADWCADWYRRLHAYSFGKFPNREQGEWHQYLDRQGQPIPIFIKKLAVKDPFHLPRTLILAIQTLRRWVRENSGAGEKPQPAEP